MEYQPCVSSGNKKAARAEAAIAVLQELAAVPVDQTVAMQPPPMVVPGAAPRPAPCPPAPQPPKPVRPLMSLQPRPQFASLYSCRPPSLAASTEPPPPGVGISDQTSTVLDDFQQLESTSVQISADRPLESSDSFATDISFTEEEHLMLAFDAKRREPQSEEKSFKTSGTVGLLGDTPQEFEADSDKFTDDADSGGTCTGYTEFTNDSQSRFLKRQHIRNAPGIFGENPENIHSEFTGGQNSTLRRPCVQFFSECEDFTKDTFVDDVSGIVDEYLEGTGELCDDDVPDVDEYLEGTGQLYDDSCIPSEEFEHWEEDFQSDICFQNPAAFSLRGIRHARPLMRQPVRSRCQRSPLIAHPPFRIPQRLPRGPPQRFPRPFDVRSPCSPQFLPRGMFRPRMRPPMRPFPRSHY